MKGNAAPTTAANTNGSTTAVAQNGVATSAIKFVGTEDLGGGMKAGFLMEINPNLAQSSTSNINYSFGGDYNGTPFNGEQFVNLAGGFGEVKLGVPNAGFFLAQNTSHPFGTAMGSAYGASGLSRLGTQALGIVSGVNSGTARIIRHERSIQYTTPTMGGFSAMVTYAAQNDNTNTTKPSNQDGYTDITLMYSNGPLNVAYSNAVNKFGQYAVPSLASAPYTLAGTTALSGVANGDYTYNVLAANYTTGATTIYGGYTTTKSNGITAATSMEDATSYNIAAKYVMGQVDLLGNYTVRTSNLATSGTVNNNNARMIGLGANYNFSKRTSVYYRFEVADINTDSKNDSATAGGSVTNASMVGIRHAF